MRKRERVVVQSRSYLTAALVLLMSSSVACRPAKAPDSLIQEYKSAACVPVEPDSQRSRPGYRWRAKLPLRDGTEVMVIGSKGGISNVSVSDLAGRVYVAAEPGDYIYPTDVRFDADLEILYVKADGLAGGIYRETLLFEYDLRRKRPLAQGRVENNLLPAECPG